MQSFVRGEDLPLDTIKDAIIVQRKKLVIKRAEHSISRSLCSYMIKNVSSITDLSLYDVLLKILSLIWDPKHCHRKGQIQHHLLKTKTNWPASFKTVTSAYTHSLRWAGRRNQGRFTRVWGVRLKKNILNVNGLCFKMFLLTLNTSNLTPIFTSA